VIFRGKNGFFMPKKFVKRCPEKKFHENKKFRLQEFFQLRIMHLPLEKKLWRRTKHEQSPGSMGQSMPRA
jgi:hypothetical protein